MSHLSIERLAALADEQPLADERTHLVQCAHCARELDAHRSLLAMARTERESMGLPLTRWDTLAERLRAEGLISGPPRQAAGGGLFNARALLQMAAALVLVASGTVIGRASAGVSLVPGGLTGTDVQKTANRLSPDSLPTTFTSFDEANRWKTAYANAYQGTVSFLASSDSAETPAVIRARLSVFDRVSRTMREALLEAPNDPVINDFYLNSFSQREASLRQLNNVLPQGVRLTGF